MFLIVPVPNPEKKTLAIKYACHTESYFTKLAVEVSKKETSSISLVVDAAKELLEVRYSKLRWFLNQSEALMDALSESEALKCRK